MEVRGCKVGGCEGERVEVGGCKVGGCEGERVEVGQVQYLSPHSFRYTTTYSLFSICFLFLPLLILLLFHSFLSPPHPSSYPSIPSPPHPLTLAPLVHEQWWWLGVRWFDPRGKESPLVCLVPEVLVQVGVCDLLQWLHIIYWDQVTVGERSNVIGQLGSCDNHDIPNLVTSYMTSLTPFPPLLSPSHFFPLSLSPLFPFSPLLPICSLPFLPFSPNL